MKRKRIAAVLFAAVLSLTAAVNPPNVAMADTLSELRARQTELANKQKDTKAALANLQAQQATLEDEIRVLDTQVYLAEEELAVLEDALAEATARYEDAVVRWEAATAEREKQFEIFQKRVKFIHENGSIGYLRVILEAQSFTDMLARMQYVYDIMDYDNKTLERLKAAEEEIAETAATMEEEKKAQEVIVAEQTEKTESLRAVLDQKNEKAKQFEQDEASYNKMLAELEEGSNEVSRLISQATASSSGYQGAPYSGGKLQWPVYGYYNISSGYVYRKKPIGSGYETHTGLDIPAPQGTDIHAAAPGKVITSGWIRGYGYTIMIDHGGGLVTLYGHNSRLVASVGDVVDTGDVIAKCGSTGNSTGPHCHFEVRVNGKHTDPTPYLNG